MTQNTENTDNRPTAEKAFRIPAISHDTLRAAGYRHWKSKGARVYATSFWQKRFRDEKGTKYFIEFYEYDNSDIPLHPFKDISYEPEAHLKLPEDRIMNVTLQFNEHQTIEEIEDFIDQVYRNMGCCHHELND